jgi:amidophosphoribosyltransferase
MRISAPPFLYPCYYGTDIDSSEHLIAYTHSIEEIKEIIGADSLGYFPLEALPELSNGQGICSACFDGCYPTEITVETGKNKFEQKLSEID